MPNIPYVRSGDALLDELVLLGSFQGHGVHAVSPADVAGVQPVDFQAACGLMFPTEEVRVGYTSGVSVGRMTDACNDNKSPEILSIHPGRWRDKETIIVAHFQLTFPRSKNAIIVNRHVIIMTAEHNNNNNVLRNSTEQSIHWKKEPVSIHNWLSSRIKEVITWLNGTPKE